MGRANLKLFRICRLVPGVGWAIGNRPTGKAAPGAKGCGGRSLDKLLFLQPEDKIVGPRMGLGEGRLVVQADAMAALLVNVQVKWHSSFASFISVGDALPIGNLDRNVKLAPSLH